jgi:4-amino-4-deoxy-L-arabinose transferase-like glycosyltransferase
MSRSFPARLWKTLSSGHRPLVLLLALGLFTAVVWGNDYGMSFDEGRNAGVGSAALNAYTGAVSYFDLGSLDEHGPAYFMFFVATSRAIHAVAPSWTLADGRHFTNFLMFLVAVAGFYSIGLRLLSKRVVVMATLLFASQPMIFGHGFINQKDTPFMGLFLATVAVGLAAADQWSIERPESSEKLTVSGALSLRVWRDEFSSLSTRARSIFVGAMLVSALVAIDLLLVGLIRRLGDFTIALSYDGRAPLPLQALFNAVATDAYKTPLSIYIDKFHSGWRFVRWGAPALLAVGLLLAGSLILPTPRDGWRRWVTDIRRPSWRWTLMASGVLLGLTICVRQLGVFAGVLVTLIVLYRGGGRSVLPLVAFWLVAFGVAVATWPYLWPSPITKFWDSMALAANFPPHQTYYRGRWLRSSKYPWFYFPNLAGIQLTEPAVALCVIGSALAVWRVVRRDSRTPLILLLILWAGVPLFALIAFKMTIYGNITHLIFILPAFFLAAGLAIDLVMQWLRHGWVQAAVLTAILLPGIWGIAWLHPYEYIYINSFAGGVSGADGFYELDRTCISLREGIEFVDRTAPTGATVMLPPQVVQVVPYARPDLRLIDNRISYDEADYVVDCTWTHGLPPWPSEDFHPVHKVMRGTAVLTIVYARNNEPQAVNQAEGWRD